MGMPGRRPGAARQRRVHGRRLRRARSRPRDDAAAIRGRGRTGLAGRSRSSRERRSAPARASADAARTSRSTEMARPTTCGSTTTCWPSRPPQPCMPAAGGDRAARGPPPSRLPIEPLRLEREPAPERSVAVIVPPATSTGRYLARLRSIGRGADLSGRETSWSTTRPRRRRPTGRSRRSRRARGARAPPGAQQRAERGPQRRASRSPRGATCSARRRQPAVARCRRQLVAQLDGAGETIGFVYPNPHLFGNRSTTSSPRVQPAQLLTGNYCDTGSLIDREVFDAGIRYPEETSSATRTGTSCSSWRNGGSAARRRGHRRSWSANTASAVRTKSSTPPTRSARTSPSATRSSTGGRSRTGPATATWTPSSPCERAGRRRSRWWRSSRSPAAPTRWWRSRKRSEPRRSGTQRC